ncbi:hypothetical protein B7463_g3071, partial [Scytalidium lignicola]
MLILFCVIRPAAEDQTRVHGMEWNGIPGLDNQLIDKDIDSVRQTCMSAAKPVDLKLKINSDPAVPAPTVI